MNALLDNGRTFWSQIGPNQRVSIIMAALLVVGAMIALFIWTQRPNLRLLYGSVSPKDAAAIVEHLDSKGISYEMRSGGSAIFVPADQVYEARMDVASQGLVNGDAVGFEIFDKNNFGVSDFIQRTNFVRAVQGELARTIQQLDGVRHARVMVVMPDNRLLLVNKDIETTASVFVEVGGSPLDKQAVRSVQSLVANAVEGLRPANVAVVDNKGQVLSKEQEDDSLMGASSNMVEYRQTLENYFGRKVESMLERVVGSGNAVVRVNAEIQSSRVTQMVEDFDEEGVLRSQSTQEELSSTVDGSSGVASMTVDEEGGQDNQQSPSKKEAEIREEDQNYEIGRTVTNTIQQPGGIQRLTASVFIAAQTRAVEGEAEPVVENRSEEEIVRLRQMVANALGISLEDPSMGSVEIHEAVFDAEPDTEMVATPTGGGTFDPLQMVQFGERIFGSLLALVFFVVFLILLKKSRKSINVFEQLKEDRQHARAERELGKPQEVTPELLNELIRQKPENAGTTLRNWLSGKSTE